MVQITVAASSKQIRYYVTSAMRAFEFLPPQDAVESNLGHLRQLLRYLDCLDKASHVVVAGISTIEGGIRLESSACDSDTFDLTDKYLSHPCSKWPSAPPLSVPLKEG
jgi:hypothetical protein